MLPKQSPAMIKALVSSREATGCVGCPERGFLRLVPLQSLKPPFLETDGEGWEGPSSC